jgi:hypothetical protein
MDSRLAEMYSRLAETDARTAGMHRGPGRIAARPDRMYGTTARFAFAPDRLFASTAHCSRRTANWLGAPCSSNSIPTTPHPVLLTCYSVPPTSHFISTMSIRLPLEARPPPPIETFSRRRERVATSPRRPTRPPRRRAQWPLSFRAVISDCCTRASAALLLWFTRYIRGTAGDAEVLVLP